MISLSDEQKALFYTGGNFKDYVFYFPDIDLTITNETIHQEAVTIKESICEDEELVLGGCIASSIEFEVSEIITQDLTGLEFTATLYVNLEENGTYDLKLPMGIYRVDSAKMVDDKDYKKVVAYDALYDASVDASDWYNRLLPDDDSATTVKEMRESLLIYLDIPFVPQTIDNDSIILKKTVRAELGSLPAIMVLKCLCEINGGFGRINREGKFEIIHAWSLALFPEEDLYPREDLYPEDKFGYIGVSTEEEDCAEYRTTHYEEYLTMPITCLIIRSDEEDTGCQIGDDVTNPYLLTGNFLLFGKNDEELRAVGEGIFKYIKNVYYRPNTTELDGLPYMETGDAYALQKKNDIIESFILSRTLKGVQGLRDTYESKGSQIRTNEVTKSAQLLQIKGRTLKIEKTVDKVSAELKDIEKGTNSKFEMTNEKIEAEVKRAKEAEGTLSTKITQTAEGITSTVSKTYETKENAQATKKDLSSKISQLTNQIELKVTAGDVESIISQKADSIRLKASKISWSSEYSSMSEDGVLKCQNAELTGSLKTYSGVKWAELKNAKLSGGYSGNTGGEINFDATKYNMVQQPDGNFKWETIHGMQIKSELLEINCDTIKIKQGGTKPDLEVVKETKIFPIVQRVFNDGEQHLAFLRVTNGMITAADLTYTIDDM